MLQNIVDRLTYGVFRMDPLSAAGQMVNFFIYDSIKILLLLFLMIFVIGILRTYISQQKIRAWLIGKGILGNVVAAVFGAVTPFCSCSSIPFFISFVKMGIPLGVNFSFLITSPLINEYLVVLMLGFFGWKITLAYVLSGLVIGIGSGLLLGSLKLEKYLIRDLDLNGSSLEEHEEFASFKERIRFGFKDAVSIVDKIWAWILVGVGIGALIHNYIPQESIQAVIAKTGVFSVPLATLIGIPMYGSCAAIVPIAVVLFQKGIPLGTALSFMMATAALSLPEAIMLRRAMTLKLIAIFFGVTTIAIILIGYLINVLQPVFKS